VLCAGYTSGSDLQGEATADSREDSRDSRGGVQPAEDCEETTAACIRDLSEWPETESSE